MNESRQSCFRDFIHIIEPVRMRDPLATLLGACKGRDDIIEYGFADVVKMSGHACPTVASAFVACKHAMRALFDDGIGERGTIAVTVHGERDDGVFGVIGQVFSLITGACPETGFKGLGGLHRRNNLLRYGVDENDSSSRFDFVRTDTKQGCRVSLIPSAFPPLSIEDAQRLGPLMEKNVWQGATKSEQIEFRDLWMSRVRMIALEERDLASWLNLESLEK